MTTALAPYCQVQGCRGRWDADQPHTLCLEQDSPQGVTYIESLLEGADPTEGFYED